MVEKYFFIVYMVMSIVCEYINNFHRLILTLMLAPYMMQGTNLKDKSPELLKNVGQLNIATTIVLFLIFSSTFLLLK